MPVPPANATRTNAPMHIQGSAKVILRLDYLAAEALSRQAEHPMIISLFAPELF